MARRGHGCRCCGCSFNNIFRCEQLSVNLWNQSGGLPVVTCDSAPSPGNLTAVSAWLTSGGFASGGQLSIDLDAAGLNLAGTSSGGGFIQAGIFQGAAVVAASPGGMISLNSDSRAAGLGNQLAISVRSCKTETGRFVTAYAPAAGSNMLTDISLTPRMSVAFRQQGEPGFTNQAIEGLRSGGSNPYWMTQACRAAVYRDGEYVGEVTRDPSLCVLLPGDSATVSRSGPPADDTAAREAKIAALEAQRAAIPNPPDPNAALRLARAAEVGLLRQELFESEQRRDFYLGRKNWAQAEKDDNFLAYGYTYSIWLLQDMFCGLPVCDFEQALCEEGGGGFSFCDRSIGGYYSTIAFVDAVGGRGQALDKVISVAGSAHGRELGNVARLEGELAAAIAAWLAVPPPPGMTQSQLELLASIDAELAVLRGGAPYDLIDYIASSDGIVRLSGYAAGRAATTSESYIGGVRIPFGQMPNVDPVVSPGFADARYFFVRQGDRFRIAIGAGGYASLSIEPSGAILGTFDDATSQEGSYLVVSKYDDDCMPSGWQGTRNFDNLDDGWQGLGGFRTYLGPFSVPVTVPRRLSQRRYEFNSFVVDKTPPSIVARQIDDFVVGSEPEWLNFAAADRVQAGPLLFADEPVVGDNGGTNWAFYTTRPPGPGMPPGYYRATNAALKDRAHNFPLLTPVVEFTIHATMSGAKATFAGADEVSRPSPLASLDLVFDQPVDGVNASHFTLEGYGRREDGTFGLLPSCWDGLSFPSDTTCRIALDTTKQPAGAMWRIVFQPAGDPDDQDDDVVTVNGGSRCILAARFAWIRPQENVRQLIDTTSGSQFTIGNTASVSASVAEPDPEQPPATALSSSSTVSLPASGGSFHANHDADSFSPNAPPDPDAGTAVPFSYFGMSTTIYPSPARLLSACAAPLEPQRHFSALMSANNYTTLTASLSHVAINGEIVTGYSRPSGTPGVLEFVEVWRGPHAQFSVQPKFAQPISFQIADGGALLSQNRWTCSDYTSGSVFAFDKSFTLGGNRLSKLTAMRLAQEYQVLATAVPGDLVLELEINASIGWSPLNENTGDNATDYNNYLNNLFVGYNSGIAEPVTYRAWLHLSKSQEYALASGSVSVVVANTSVSSTPGVTPEGLFTYWGQLNRNNINRHVWTLQAS